jgi:hypothetical protein
VLSISASPVRPPYERKEDGMKYMLMIYDRDDWWETATAEDMARGMEAHGAFAAYLQGRGGAYSGEALQPTKTATTIRPNGGGDMVGGDRWPVR